MPREQFCHIKQEKFILLLPPGPGGGRQGKDLSVDEFFPFHCEAMPPGPSVIVVIIQLGEHRFAAFVRENSLFFGEKCHLLSHFAYNVLINLVASGLHFNSDAHFQVFVFQGEEGNKIINEISVN